MSVENEVKAAVTAVEGEAKKVEDTVATKLEEVVQKVEGEAKKAIVNISTEEKLFLREAELEYVKAQMEIQRLSKITESKSKEYQNFIESLLKKYTLDKAEYVFDAVTNAFKKL